MGAENQNPLPGLGVDSDGPTGHHVTQASQLPFLIRKVTGLQNSHLIRFEVGEKCCLHSLLFQIIHAPLA